MSPGLLFGALLALLLLGAGAPTVSADTAQQNSTADEGNVTDIYDGGLVDGPDTVADLARTPDGGLLAVKYTSSSEQSTILRIDASDEVVRTETLPGALESIQQVDEDSYAVVGSRGDDVLLARIRVDGRIEWTETYGGDGKDLATDVASAPDGHAYVLSTTESFGVDTSDMWILRVDGDGEVVWDRRVAHEKWAAFPIGERLQDGSLIATIRTERSMDETVDGDQNISVARIAPDGSVVWRTLFSGAGDTVDKDEVFDVLPAHGDGVLLFGLSNTGNEGWHPDFWAVRLTPDGTVEWQRQYDTPTLDYGADAVRTSDGYVLVGFAGPDSDEPSTGKMIGIAGDGSELFTETYDRVPQLPKVGTRFTAVEWTTDGRLAVSGMAINREERKSAAWIVDFSGAVSRVEPGPSTWDTQRRSAVDPSNDDIGSGTDGAVEAGSPSDGLVLYTAAALSFAALFVPYGVRRFRRRHP